MRGDSPNSSHGLGRPLLALAASVALFLAGCAGSDDRGPAAASATRPSEGDAAPETTVSAPIAFEIPMTHDPHSYSRPDEVRVRHIHLDLEVDFDAKALRGSAVIDVARNPAFPSAPLRLDAKALEIGSVASGDERSWKPTRWFLGSSDAVRGEEVIVELNPGDSRVRVEYQTTAGGTGLQWLDPAQTAGAKRPFLFSQSQAIHARTWFPCQDSPGVRMTYSARIRTPADLRAVMSARNTTPEGRKGEFTFEMPQAIPSYLVALAVGELEFRELGPRSGVFAEKPVIDRAAWEFADAEKMIAAVEGLYGPYRWERYDILVLPPSFPFGGMENPRTTFATPTAIVGDRSGVSLIAHELAHSWSGNLVTNATWRDFWLNEGFTVYLEQRIMEAVYGRDRYETEVALGVEDLKAEMADLAPADQILYVDLGGRDPDDGFTEVPYQKGAAFLRLCEATYGRERFDPFLKGWFERNAFRSVTTQNFLAYLNEGLLALDAEKARSIGVEEWIHKPGLPANLPVTESALLGRAAAAARAFVRSGELIAGTEGWSTQEWLHFLNSLGVNLPEGRLAALDRARGFSATENSEIACVWFETAIKNGYEPAMPGLEKFLLRQGRRKFLKPLYTALAATPNGLVRGRAIYEKARPLYHAIAAQTIDQILGLGK